MTIIGSVDHYVYPSINALNECYTSIFNFLTSSNAKSVGIELVAFSSGSRPGTGSGYWDEQLRFGNNAWCVFRFASASLPFYMHFQYCESGGIFGATPGSGARIANVSSASKGGIGWQVAFREDGGNPWNGTTGSINGSDVKRTTVWVSGSSRLYVFPRSNSSGGVYTTLRENMSPIFSMPNSTLNVTNPYNQGVRFHLVADEENFLMMSSPGIQDYYFPCYFGKYFQPPGCPQNNLPYFMFSSTTHPDIKSIFDVSTLIGNASGDPLFNSVGKSVGVDGGVAFKGQVTISGVFSYNIDSYIGAYLSQLQPNVMLSENPQYELRTFNILVNDGNLRGLLGKCEFFGLAQGFGANSLSDDKKWIALAGSNNSSGDVYAGYLYENFLQWIIPWDGMTQSGECFHRNGRQWRR